MRKSNIMLKTVVLLLIAFVSVSVFANKKLEKKLEISESVRSQVADEHVSGSISKEQASINLSQSSLAQGLQEMGGIFGGGTNWNIKEEQITELVAHVRFPGFLHAQEVPAELTLEHR